VKSVVFAGAAGILATAVGGCSTVLEGRYQSIMVNTNPIGAECGLYRQNLRIATVPVTPSNAVIEKSKHGIWVVCVKPGYQQAARYNKSGIARAALGNVFLGGGGGIGWAIDSASGADNKYDSPVNITLIPNAPGQDEASATLPIIFATAAPAQVAAAPAQAPTVPIVGAASQQAAASPAPPPVAEPEWAAESPAPRRLDGAWLIEMQLMTTHGNTVVGECPALHSAPVTFSNQSAEGPRGRLRLTRDGELGGWMAVPAGDNSTLSFIVNLSGRMSNTTVVRGTVSGHCTGSFLMTRQ
jgi:hypothetical protein